MSLSPLPAATRVGDQAYAALHAAIVDGTYQGGRRLQIRDLAAELGISVMPVREAITRLEEDGLVETRPRRGAVVRSFSPAELLDIYDVRRVLEVRATELGVAALGGDAGDAGAASDAGKPAVTAGELEPLYDRMLDALDRGDVLGHLTADEELLSAVYEASANKVLCETIRSLWAQCRHYKIVGVREELESKTPAEILTHQRRLIDAVAAGDARAAARVTEASLTSAMERIRGALG